MFADRERLGAAHPHNLVEEKFSGCGFPCESLELGILYFQERMDEELNRPELAVQVCGADFRGRACFAC